MVAESDQAAFRQEPRINKVALVNGATIAPVDTEYGMPYYPFTGPFLWAIDGEPRQVEDAVKTLDQSPLTSVGTSIAAKAQELVTLIENAKYEELYGGTKLLDRITQGSTEERNVLFSAVMNYMRWVSKERRNKEAYGGR
jgi:hypothetical protein